MNIYVGNLAFSTTADEIRSSFENFGTVTNVSLITDKYTGKSKGFAFVEMSDDNEAKTAIESLNDREMAGRNLRINEARPREEGGARREGGGGRYMRQQRSR